MGLEMLIAIAFLDSNLLEFLGGESHERVRGSDIRPIAGFRRKRSANSLQIECEK